MRIALPPFSLLRITALLTLLTSGCVLLIPDSPSVWRQRALFKELCNAKERSIIYDTAEVEGYLTASDGSKSCLQGWDPLIEYGYRCAECTTAKIANHDLPEGAEIYLYTLEPEGHPDCGTGEKHFADYSRSTYHGNSPNYKDTNLGDNYKKRHQAQLAGKCLVVKKVAKPKSRYMMLTEYIYIDEGKEYSEEEIQRRYHGDPYPKRTDRDKGLKGIRDSSYKKGLITSGRHRTIDRQTGAVLSQYRSYTFFPHGQNKDIGLGTQKDCKTDVEWITPNQVLIPKTKQ